MTDIVDLITQPTSQYSVTYLVVLPFLMTAVFLKLLATLCDASQWKFGLLSVPSSALTILTPCPNLFESLDRWSRQFASPELDARWNGKYYNASMTSQKVSMATHNDILPNSSCKATSNSERSCSVSLGGGIVFFLDFFLVILCTGAVAGRPLAGWSSSESLNQGCWNWYLTSKKGNLTHTSHPFSLR